MHFNDGIVEFGFDCKARKFSNQSVPNENQLWLFDSQVIKNTFLTPCALTKVRVEKETEYYGITA